MAGSWAWALLVAAALPAEPPLELEVDGPFEVDLEARRGVGRGEVRITRGPLRVCCGRVELSYADGDVVHAVCSDRVALIYGEEARGTADRLVYAEGRFRLEGRVRLWAGGGRLTGERLSLDLRASKVRLTGSPSRWAPDPGPAALPRSCAAP